MTLENRQLVNKTTIINCFESLIEVVVDFQTLKYFFLKIFKPYAQGCLSDQVEENKECKLLEDFSSMNNFALILVRLSRSIRK